MSRCPRVVYDGRGTGLSDPVIGAPSLDDRVQDLSCVFEAAGLTQASLFRGPHRRRASVRWLDPVKFWPAGPYGIYRRDRDSGSKALARNNSRVLPKQ